MGINLLFSLLLLAFLIAIDLYTFKYPMEARLFPWVIGIPATIMMLVQTVKEFSRWRHAASTATQTPQQYKNEDIRAFISIIVWMAGLLAMIYLLGFIVAILLFVFFYLKTNGLPWHRSLGLAVGLIVVVYLIFTLGMEMRLYPGLIAALISE